MNGYSPYFHILSICTSTLTSTLVLPPPLVLLSLQIVNVVPASSSSIQFLESLKARFLLPVN